MFIRYNDAVSIIHKTKKDKSFMSNVASRNFFDLNSAVRGAEKRKDGNLVLLSSRGRGYIDSNQVSSNQSEINRYQTVMGKVISGHLGETDKDGKVKVISTIDILHPKEVTTDSYLVVGSYDTLEESQNTAKYLSTKTLRFLLLQALTSMNISKGSFKFVPFQNFTPNSDIDWSQSVADIDRQLYAKYGLTEDEIAFIESMIKPM